MSKGFRVLLQIFQALFALGALVFMTFSFLMAYMDFGATDAEERFVDTWIIGLTILSVAFSPSLWSLARGGDRSGVPQQAGSFDRVAPAPPVQQPSQPGGVFEPMQSSQAPAPPSSSYGQPSAGGMTPTSSPQAGSSPWGGGR
jgi:hypothetical protein